MLHQEGQQQPETATPGASTSASERNDYVAPGLVRIHLDDCFRNMVVADPALCDWRYFRREIPHLWYKDRRTPPIGFVNRDEAHILYNSALQFRGQPALEIGCWLGWSACHLARAGVLLDVIDPVLGWPDFHAAVAESLSLAGVLENVNLVAGLSPQKVYDLAQQGQRRWSLLFIDGNHDAPFPLNDTIACEPFAEDDAMILFHDLASPDVSQGLDYLQERGWNTMVYHTMQVMGVAWRGNVEPVRHYPDPSVHWPWPVHLRRHPQSGWSQDFDPDQSRAEFFRLYEAVRPFTRLADRSGTALYTLARTICRLDLPGNFVECGTVHSGAAALLAYVIKTYSKRSRKVYFCEPFQDKQAATAPDQLQGSAFNKTGEDDGLVEICRKLGIGHVLVPLKNLSADTWSTMQTEIGPIALLHVNGESCGPTMNIFDQLFDQIIPGGMIQIADFGRSEECKRAVHDFEHHRGVRFDLHPTDHTGAWLRKD
jgi:macrocin-O-methyltransferase TylF-like protien/methyltransferase family protein